VAGAWTVTVKTTGSPITSPPLILKVVVVTADPQTEAHIAWLNNQHKIARQRFFMEASFNAFIIQKSGAKN